MSRVHDALKRTAHERSKYEDVDLEIGSPVGTPASGPIPVASAVHMAPPHANPLVTSTAGALPLPAPLAHCPQTVWKPDTKTMLFFGSEEQVHSTEELRMLRSRLYQLRESQPLKKILVTSALPGEGRSFMAANLAQVLACQPGCRALLIDADLRNPRLHLALGTAATPGLSEYLLGETEESRIIQRGQMENLFFIPSGRPVSAQTEVVSNGRLKCLLDRLEPLFDWIVVDSPAAMAVSDSGLLANFCDGVLMVVRSNATPFDVVRQALQRFRPERIVGVVLNAVPTETHPDIQKYYGTSRRK